MPHMTSFATLLTMHFIVLVVFLELHCSNFHYTVILWKSKMLFRLLNASVSYFY